MSNSQDAKVLLAEYKTEVDKLLVDYFSSKRKDFEHYGDRILELFDRVAEFTTRGGKRLRPALVYYGYRLFKEDHNQDVVNMSIFMELLQSFLLIHDDIIDRSPLRRAKPTMHSMYEADTMFARDSVHSGTTMAILAGDMACQLAYELIGEAPVADSIKVRLLSTIASKVNSVICGEALDYFLPFELGYQEQDVIKIDVYKTATYTYELPLLVGAILAEVSNGRLQALQKFARPAGITFQIRDDVLGMFGDDEKTGKLGISDIAEGKITLLILEAYKNGDAQQKKILDRYVGKRTVTEKEAQQVRQVVKDTGSLAYSKIASEMFVDQSKQELDKLETEKDSEGWEFLNSIVEHMILRDV